MSNATIETVKWIRCKDQMPPESEAVLVYQSKTGRIGIGMWMQRDDGKMWTFNGSTVHEAMLRRNKNLAPREFTHWMPLPNPPKR